MHGRSRTVFPTAGLTVLALVTSGVVASGAPVRGVVNDYWADLVIGKADFGERVPNEVTGSRVFNPGGVIVDRSVTPNRIYVYDGANSRVLGLHVDAPSGSRAEIVLGQPGLDGHSACNGDSNFQNYPQRAPASASTLCSMPESQISPREGGSFANMAVDLNGNLYVPDFDNHRVLFYQSPFDTDTIADDVWGQADFSGNECNRNRGVGQPDASSLCYRSPGNEGFVGGVGLDLAGNLWITDNQNNRVLRFPYNPATGRAGHVADLVLGQPGFVTDGRGSGMNQMSAPAAVRVSAGGSVYVADSLNNRVLIFDPPFSNGMAAARTLGSNLWSPTSIEFDFQGDIWVSDSVNNQLLRFTPAGVVDRVLFKDQPTYDGGCGGSFITDGPPFFFPGPGVSQDSASLCDSRGSIGIDSSGNIWVTGSNFLQDVRRYPAPFPAPQAGIAHSADVELFQGYNPGESNDVTAKGLSDPRGVVVAANQLIVSDAGRILFWNNASTSLTNGKAADGVIWSSAFNHIQQPVPGLVKVDGQNRLWTMGGDEVRVYALPLVTGAAPIFTLRPPIAIKGGSGSVTWASNLDIAGLAVTSNASHLWLTDINSSRVIRIAGPLTSQPVVDVVLGQADAAGNQCNRGRGLAFPSADSLCFASKVNLDRNGNVFVSDGGLQEGAGYGNHRLLEYNASLFPAAPATAVFGVPANRVYGTAGSFIVPGCAHADEVPSIDLLCDPMDVAFSPTGAMVVGMNNRHFPLVYADPLNNPSQVTQLNDFYSVASAPFYAADGTLYFTDQNRGHVLVYRAGVTTVTVSGRTGVGGVTLSYSDGVPRTAVSDANGNYSFSVPSHWSGTVTPSKSGVTFTPASRTYSNLVANQSGQNYAAVLTFTSSAANDGWVLESSETSNTGGSVNGSATTFRLGDDASNRQYRAILSFDTASLPDNAVIQSATVRFKRTGTVGANPFNSLGSLWLDIRQGAFVFAALETGDFNATASAGKVAGGAGLSISSDGWHDAPLNATGLGKVNRMGLTQFRLYFAVDDNNNHVADYATFASGDSASNRPQLTMTVALP